MIISNIFTTFAVAIETFPFNIRHSDRIYGYFSNRTFI